MCYSAYVKVSPWILLSKLRLIAALPLLLGYAVQPVIRTTPVDTNQVVKIVQSDLTLHKPSFPDYRENYQQTVVIPERAREAAEAARQAELAAQAQVQPQAAYAAPQAPTGSCYDWLAQAGITDVVSAYALIMRESGCDPTNWNGKAAGLAWSVNRACGIGQQLPCGKWPHVWNDPVGGLIDMQSYVFATYGSWANALGHSYAYNYY